MSTFRGSFLEGRGTVPKWFRRVGLPLLTVALVLSLGTIGFAQRNASTTIVGTDHDFTGYGWWDGGVIAPDPPLPGTPAADGVNHCAVCHGPPAFSGGSSAPVWNHRISTASYSDSWNLTATPTAPAGTSLRCLNCHDGTVNVDAFNPDGPWTSIDSVGTVAIAPADGGYIGTVLTKHHPIGINYSTAYTPIEGGLNEPTATDSYLGGTVAEKMLDGGFIRCTSCHEQHNDRQYDKAGGDPNDDPAGDPADITTGDFVVLQRLCFRCHMHEAPPETGHHIPGREDPWGDSRGTPFNCTMCHGADLLGGGGGHIPACTKCHIDVTRDSAQTGNATITTGHHGGNRTTPYFDCAVCHADPLTDVVTGNDFGTLFARSCYECHDDVWANGGAPVVGDLIAVTKPSGTVNQTVTFDFSSVTDPDGDPLAFEWTWGDGTQPQMPSRDSVATHTYTEYGTFQVTVAVTDGKHPPVHLTFPVLIAKAAVESGPDAWTIIAGADTFVETFEDRGGSLIGTKDDTKSTLAFGIEFVDVIFWMDLWMDLSGDSYWGTGDTYFGNIDRDAGTMTGVKFGVDGTVTTFDGTKTP